MMPLRATHGKKEGEDDRERGRRGRKREKKRRKQSKKAREMGPEVELRKGVDQQNPHRQFWGGLRGGKEAGKGGKNLVAPTEKKEKKKKMADSLVGAPYGASGSR